MFWASIWHLDLENRIRGSGEIHDCKYWEGELHVKDGELRENIDLAASREKRSIQIMNFSASPDPIFWIKVSNSSSEHSQYNGVKIIPVLILFPS